MTRGKKEGWKYIRTREKPGPGATWTKEEEKQVIEFAESHPNHGDVDKLAKRLNRSKRAVLIKYSRLKLSKEWNISKNGKPTEKEKEAKAKLAQKNKAIGKFSSMTKDKARKLFDKFKKTSTSLILFSRKVNYSADHLSEIFRKYWPDEYDMIQEERLARRDLWYKRGRNFEYIVRNYLKNKGFWVL